jgi:hypothetical protein
LVRHVRLGLTREEREAISRVLRDVVPNFKSAAAPAVNNPKMDRVNERRAAQSEFK